MSSVTEPTIHGPATVTSMTSYFAAGESTAKIGIQNLPRCTSPRVRVAGTQLRNSDTGLVVGESGPSSDVLNPLPVTTRWNVSAVSTLTPLHSGAYRCYDDKLHSKPWTVIAIGK